MPLDKTFDSLSLSEMMSTVGAEARRRLVRTSNYYEAHARLYAHGAAMQTRWWVQAQHPMDWALYMGCAGCVSLMVVGFYLIRKDHVK